MRIKSFEPLSSENESGTGMPRREFLKLCGILAGAMGLPYGMASRIAAAVASPARPPVIWLHFQECTGCTESLLRSTHPKLDTLLLDLISLDYHETLCAAAGAQVEEAMKKSMEANKGKYVCVIEGSIPTKDGGIYCKIAGRTAVDIVKEVAAGAAAVIAIGSCASWGGVQSTPPNPTGASGAAEVLKGTTVVNIPGCPPNPYNILGTIVHFLTFKKLPALDELNRPRFGYGRLIHENCERRPHFDAGRFAETFGDENHRAGYCLYKLGCKGPETYANCPTIQFCDISGAWPVGIGHPCFGCVEGTVGFKKPLHDLATLHGYTPPDTYPPIDSRKGGGLNAGAAALLGAVAGAAVGAGVMVARKMPPAGEKGAVVPVPDRPKEVKKEEKKEGKKE
jgi:hydrogenase small subunit